MMLPVHEMLDRSALEYAPKTAVVCGADNITYGDLQSASVRLAQFLTARGIGKEDRIGILARKSIEEVIAIFAILRTGAAFVHLNPAFQAKQLNHVLSDCGISTLFLSDAHSLVIANCEPAIAQLENVISLTPELRSPRLQSGSVFYLEQILRTSQPSHRIPIALQGADPAAIIYTSGSTGMPRGIIVTQSILSDSTVTSASVLDNNSDDRLISVTPLSFDGALSQLFTAIWVGGTLIQQPSAFPKDIVDTLTGQNITGMHAVPSLWNILLRDRSPFPHHSYPHLRYVSIIGETFSEARLAELRTILGDTRVFLMYGTTEAFRSTYLPPEQLDQKPESVGVPFPGVEISVVDEAGNRLPTGATGEIVHRGAFVSPGYWGRGNTRATNSTFRNGAVFTGDLGRIDSDGFLYFVGRKDGLIKTQGYRVSPDEVARCISEIIGVEEVAVVGALDADANQVVKALVVAAEPGQVSARDITTHCRRHLPYYMIPRAVEFRDSLPKTATHKLRQTTTPLGR